MGFNSGLKGLKIADLLVYCIPVYFEVFYAEHMIIDVLH
jgi:hypothetical protein